MMKFGIVSDSSCDLAQEYTEKEKVTVVPFYVSFDGENYYREGKEIPVTEFYRKMEAQTGLLSQNLHAVGAGLQGCFPSVCHAGMSGSVHLPDKNIQRLHAGGAERKTGAGRRVSGRCHRSYGFSAGHCASGNVCEGGCQAEKSGKVAGRGGGGACADPKHRSYLFLTTKDLKYLEHGGRIGKAASVAGSVLNIKPLLQYYDGELASPEICRGRKKSLQKMIEMFFSYIEKHQIRPEEYHLATGVGLPVPEYETFKQQLREGLQKRGYHVTEWEEIQIGATIGVHTGPYPMGVGFLKRCQ